MQQEKWPPPSSSEAVRTVLVADLIEDIVSGLGSDDDEPLPVVVKMDIEMMECKAILGSLVTLSEQLGGPEM